ncbi:MAG TPA: hypothetical protein VGP92_04030 [Acidimicrobiia bacterium]|nr:hypothetical protein [Acidimicrobiia bacterium]
MSKVDVVVGSIGFAGFLLKGPGEDALVAMGLLPEPHPLAVGMRTVSFLRDLDLDPAEILGDDVVEAVDRVLAFPRQRVFRRTFRQAIALMLPLSIRSQRAFAAK